MSPAGQAQEWAERAGRGGVTLRFSWPAYQETGEGFSSERLAWWASHLLILEVSPSISEIELRQIAEVLRGLLLGETRERC